MLTVYIGSVNRASASSAIVRGGVIKNSLKNVLIASSLDVQYCEDIKSGLSGENLNRYKSI